MEITATHPRTWRSAWQSFTPSVERIIQTTGAKTVMELGGGRSPTLPLETVERLGFSYIVTDLSESELDRAPVWVEKAQIDLMGEVPNHLVGSADFVFSKMLMEHIPDYRRAYMNIYKLLKPGGVSFAFHPTIAAFPFVVNKLLPEGFSDKILTALFPSRTDDGEPKFPAFYSGCIVSPRFRDELRGMGFSHVEQVPFFGHDYYKRFPGVRVLAEALARLQRKRQMERWATYTHTIATR